MFYVGTAGWALRKEHVEHFASEGTHLERYARTFNAVEINSSFYRSHRRSTYERWAASTPEAFRFSVKMPKEITHQLRLRGCGPQLASFLNEIAGLREKCGVLLVQLPPSLKFDAKDAEIFFQAMRSAFLNYVACEPRHESWFHDEAKATFLKHKISRVAADPTPVIGADRPGGDVDCVYYRWHGTPTIYYSRYESDAIIGLTQRIRNAEKTSADVWCIFDNTAEGAATLNAIELRNASGCSEHNNQIRPQ